MKKGNSSYFITVITSFKIHQTLSLFTRIQPYFVIVIISTVCVCTLGHESAFVLQNVECVCSRVRLQVRVLAARGVHTADLHDLPGCSGQRTKLWSRFRRQRKCGSYGERHKGEERAVKGSSSDRDNEWVWTCHTGWTPTRNEKDRIHYSMHGRLEV